ncbi:hypothetical protein M406DRAFT_283721 [Cryphonectria parasitica EP155]|uniref:PAN2-PAN3 deadenylation complex subunit PAN3 n=1 Tax=Cryphonectria parasitica (strain ATCC 38755 / EP155) TaxID=660469 RepID=A0A9P5CHK2_CRYP1|nr:uncharacterized protein M406DRAFT_283721 [Cryphonectria parasitica EP155]KAF3760008.1 hypothetical protein M406DRAFT_283721 [Cryphonectria parasitica EP155]
MAGNPDLRRQVGSPRPKGRDKDTLCRNILIYGKCRYENAGCNFNHEPPNNNFNPAQNHAAGSSGSIFDMKKTLNGDSPSFTPSNLAAAVQAQPAPKKSTLPSQAASAAVFTPRGAGSATPAPSEPERDRERERVFNPASIKEFTPQNNNNSFDLGGSTNNTTTTATATATPTPEPNNLQSYDPFQASVSTAQYNPYANDHTGGIAGPSTTTAASYYQGQGAYPTPLQPPPYHLYANIGPYREDLLPYQRQTRDFFMPEDLREELQKKAHAALQVIPSSIQLEGYHSLVPLDKVDTPQRKSTTIFGWTSWLFKSFSAKTGRIYCLRRLQDFRLGDREATQAIETIKKWKQINNGSVVFVHDAFTTSAFGDRSLVFALDYFPLAQTLVEAHLTQPPKDHRYRGPATVPKIPESVIWTYVAQIASALKAIHAKDLAARCLDPSKIIVTEKNRIRLTACAILDVVQYQAHRSVKELQQEDFVQLGRLILCLANTKLPSQLVDLEAEMATVARRYQSGPKGESALHDLVQWLLSTPNVKSAEQLITGMPNQMVECLDRNLQHTDMLTNELQRELENGRVVRLLMKLGTINERLEYDGDPSWSENGERYTLKLFRDYVFHRVDEHARPVFDVGHMLSCLNKLDAGSAERIRLTSRNNETDFIITYAELKKQVNSAFADLMKHNRRA